MTVMCVLISTNLHAQKTIILLHNTKSPKYSYYNLDCANVFFINTSDTFFIEKVDEYRFAISPEIVKSIVSSNKASLMIETYNYLYTVELNNHYLLKSSEVKIGFFKSKNVSNSHVEYSFGPYVVPGVMQRKRVKRTNTYLQRK